MRRALLGLVLLVGVLPVARAQVPVPPPSDGEPLVEELAEDLVEDLVDEAAGADPEALVELLADLRDRPLDVNRASAADLAVVPALSARLAAAIVAEREANGAFLSVAALRRVPGLTEEALARAAPYLTAAPPEPTRRLPALRRDLRAEARQRVQRRLELSRGYEPVPDSLLGTPDEPSHYRGSPERLYTRLRVSSGRQLSLNATLEKDPGEPFTWNPTSGFYGYDFVSMHAALMDVGRVEALVVGDFVAEFGQGVALWRASGFGKGREAVRPLVRRGRGLRPYGSTDELRFFRGAAATVRVAPFLAVSGFASRRRLDARFADADSAVVLGLPQTGLHRTPLEIARKQALGQSLAGGAAELRLPRATLGVAGYATRFDEPLAPGDRPHQRFGFGGDRAAMASVYGSASLGSAYVFGEVARAPRGVLGGVAGAETALGPLELLVLARHFPRDFVSLHGHAFGERNGATQNETGVYLGARAQPARRWVVSGYVDQFRFPWARADALRPSTGLDALLYVEHRPRPWLTVSTQGRTKTRETGERLAAPTGALLDGLVRETRQTLRFQGELVASRHLRLRSRLEGARYVRADAPAEYGTVLFHDVRWAPRTGLTLDARLSHFDTDSFGARLYQFENDLLGVLSNVLLSGRGTRAYALLSLRPSGRLEGLVVQGKLAATAYRDRDIIGSGLDRIEGRRVRDVGVQVRYRF